MAKKKYDLWFSKKQRKIQVEQQRIAVFGRLEDGKIVEYTEASSVGKKPTGLWKDYKYLGRGDYHHSEPV